MQYYHRKLLQPTSLSLVSHIMTRLPTPPPRADKSCIIEQPDIIFLLPHVPAPVTRPVAAIWTVFSPIHPDPQLVDFPADQPDNRRPNADQDLSPMLPPSLRRVAALLIYYV